MPTQDPSSAPRTEHRMGRATTGYGWGPTKSASAILRYLSNDMQIERRWQHEGINNKALIKTRVKLGDMADGGGVGHQGHGIINDWTKLNYFW